MTNKFDPQMSDYGRNGFGEISGRSWHVNFRNVFAVNQFRQPVGFHADVAKGSCMLVYIYRWKVIVWWPKHWGAVTATNS